MSYKKEVHLSESSLLSQVMMYGGALVALLGIYYGGYEGIIEPLLPNHTFASEDLTQLVIGIFLFLLGAGAPAAGEKQAVERI